MGGGGDCGAAARGVPPGHERWSETAAQVTEISDRSRLFGVAPVTVSFVTKKKCNAVTVAVVLLVSIPALHIHVWCRLTQTLRWTAVTLSTRRYIPFITILIRMRWGWF